MRATTVTPCCSVCVACVARVFGGLKSAISLGQWLVARDLGAERETEMTPLLKKFVW